ncbi:hypothetical protein [Streptomyces sp. NPDC005828]|uniref:hypothetical protein n=1 Tax=Streptomyces sp. NPDC005828 TaxID=3157071 RepID=UPI0033D44E3E
MGDAIRGSRGHVKKQQGQDEPDRSREPPEESMDELATRIRKEVGEAGRRLRREAAWFGKEPPGDRGNRGGP